MFRTLRARMGSRGFRSITLLAPLCFLTACPPAAVNYNYASLPNPVTSLYKVHAGDVVHIRVMRNQNTTGRYTVRPDGYISLPLGGEIKVAGLATDQVRSAVVARLKKFLDQANSMVSVSLEQVRGITYSVIGEVTRAGSFTSTRYVTLLEGLANAGGLSPYAKSDGIYVLRARLKIPVSYPQTIKDPSGNRNFYLLSGDIIVVR